MKKQLVGSDWVGVVMALMEFADKGHINPNPHLMDAVHELTGGEPKARTEGDTDSVVTPAEGVCLEAEMVAEAVKRVVLLPQPTQLVWEVVPPRPAMRPRTQEEVLNDLAEYEARRRGKKDLTSNIGSPTRDVRDGITMWANAEAVTLKYGRNRTAEITVYLREHGWPSITEAEVAKTVQMMVNNR